MKRNILSAVLTLYCLLPIAAQPLSKADSLQIEIAQLENALTSIQTDLQEKTLQYNWEITEKYIEYCKKLYKITNFNREPRLIQLATTIKPEELEPQRLAYEKAKKELEALLTSYPEYITLDSLYKRAINTEQKKDRKVALDGFYQRIYNEDKAYRPLLEKKRTAFKEHYIACASYLLDECKRNQEVVPEIYDYKTARILKETDPKLHQLSIEISTLESLQRETIRKYQRLKYNLKDNIFANFDSGVSIASNSSHRPRYSFCCASGSKPKIRSAAFNSRSRFVLLPSVSYA